MPTYPPSTFGDVPRWLLNQDAEIALVAELASIAALQNFVDPEYRFARIVTTTGTNFYYDASLDVPVPTGTSPTIVVGLTGRVWKLIPEDNTLAGSLADIAALTGRVTAAEGQITSINATNAAQQVEIDAAEATVTALTASVAAAKLLFLDRADAIAATIPAAVERIYLMFHTYANGVGGGFYRRASFADLTAYPAAAYFRSVDREMPGPTGTDSTNGGYWVLDEPSPGVACFGGIPNGVATTASPGVFTGTDCTAAAQAWLLYYIARLGPNPTAGGARRHVGPMRWGPGVWRLSGSLNFAQLSTLNRKCEVYADGAQLLLDGSNLIPFDMTDAEYMEVHGFLACGSAVSTPLCFIKTGRKGDNDTGARNSFHHCSTRYSTNQPSHFRIAAFWSVGMEESAFTKCIWENNRSDAADPLSFAYAADTLNFLGYFSPVTVTAVTLASNPLFTANAHGLVNGDVVVLGETVGLVGPSAEILTGRAYLVASASTNTFRLTLLDGSTISTLGYTAFVSGTIHKERWASPNIGDSRATPYKRMSAKHITHLECVFSCNAGRAAVFQGSCEDNRYISCFATGDEGFLFAFGSDASGGFNGCQFDMHVEGGAGGGTVIAWARFMGITAAAATITVAGCTMKEVALQAESTVFRVEAGVTNVRLVGGSIEIYRDSTAGAWDKKLFSGAGSLFDVRGTTVILPAIAYSGVAVVNATVAYGRFTSLATGLTVDVAPSFTVATLPPAADWRGGQIVVSDAAGGFTMAISNGTNWVRVQDLAIVS
jgi:hypothetical protein